MKKRLNRQSLLIFGTFLVLSLTSLLVTHIGQSELYLGDDIHFHLSRIEGLVLGIQQGDFFPKINYFFNHGMGYATPLFYPDLFLYPAAFLRLLGLSISQAYTGFLFLINLLTYLAAYFSFFSYKKQKGPSFLFAVLYGCASYRLSDLTERAAVGELLAFIFLPVALAGLYQIVYGEAKRFYWLAIGMACLILSHVLSAFMFAMFIFFYILLNFRVFFKEKERIRAFLKTICLTIFLCLGFLLPMAEQIMDQSFYFQTVQVARVSASTETGLYYLKTALRNSAHNNLGIVIILLFIILLMSWKNLARINKKLFLLSSFCLIAATNLIPYRFLDDTFFNSIQFPWRFFSVGTLGICWLFADQTEQLFPKRRPRKTIVSFVLISSFLLMIIHSVWIVNPNRYTKKTDINHLGSLSLGWGGEYLPSKSDLIDLYNGDTSVQHTSEVTVSQEHFSYGKIHLDYDTSLSRSEHLIGFPFIYYKGYRVNTETKQLAVYNSSKFPGFCTVVVKGAGTLELIYQWTMIQRMSFLISMIAWVSMGIILYRKRMTDLADKQE